MVLCEQFSGFDAKVYIFKMFRMMFSSRKEIRFIASLVVLVFMISVTACHERNH